MTKTQLLLSSALSTLLIAGISAPVQAAKPGMEKCGGIAKAGKNDCGTSKHACAGQAVTNGDKEEWLYVPTGSCEKIVGGEVKKSKA